MKAIPLLFIFLCSSVLSAQNCGYPGDANNDGLANYLDLIAIGLVYDTGFSPRDNPGNTWQLNCWDPWPGIIPGTFFGAGFADSDGSGFIDSLDLDAIVLNYDSLQLDPANPLPQVYDPDTMFSSPCALFLISYSLDDMNPQKFYAHIDMDVSPTSFPGALAVGMQLGYDSELLVEDSTRVLFDPMDADLMGVGAAPFSTSFQRQLPPGRVQFAVSGRGENVLNSPRRLASVAFIVTEDVIIRPDTIEFQLVPESIYVIHSSGQRICAESEVASIPLVLNAFEEGVDAIVLFPNPVQNRIHLKGNPSIIAGLQQAVLWQNGALIKRFSQPGMELDLAGLPPGLYMLELHSAEKTYWKRVLIF